MIDPHNFEIVDSGNGYCEIVDEYGVEVDDCHYTTIAEAKRAILRMIDNYEPPDIGDAWTGGFADNH